MRNLVAWLLMRFSNGRDAGPAISVLRTPFICMYCRRVRLSSRKVSLSISAAPRRNKPNYDGGTCWSMALNVFGKIALIFWVIFGFSHLPRVQGSSLFWEWRDILLMSCCSGVKKACNSFAISVRLRKRDVRGIITLLAANKSSDVSACIYHSPTKLNIILTAQVYVISIEN